MTLNVCSPLSNLKVQDKWPNLDVCEEIFVITVYDVNPTSSSPRVPHLLPHSLLNLLAVLILMLFQRGIAMLDCIINDSMLLVRVWLSLESAFVGG